MSKIKLPEVKLPPNNLNRFAALGSVLVALVGHTTFSANFWSKIFDLPTPFIIIDKPPQDLLLGSALTALVSISLDKLSHKDLRIIDSGLIENVVHFFTQGMGIALQKSDWYNPLLVFAGTKVLSWLGEFVGKPFWEWLRQPLESKSK